MSITDLWNGYHDQRAWVDHILHGDTAKDTKRKFLPRKQTLLYDRGRRLYKFFHKHKMAEATAVILHEGMESLRNVHTKGVEQLHHKTRKEMEDALARFLT